ncbi:hypothetical protein DSM104299_04377 [Baekduia alba]|uniref:hypothetical protein n=1 Tax=Baekduia alba TaxID=2997333 RepID=UPI002341375A|nr:hypothetical protein [Baekduia alba]WCB95628.1 hypothetical protein DSM104299_04377 [Baekduia alba]
MRTIRVLAVTALAVLGLTALAVAQSTTTFTVGGTVSVHGGTKAKPKPGGLSFTFDVADPSGNQSPPVQTYSIMYEGGRLNTGLIPGCSADKINTPATPTPDVCPKGSKMGAGRLDALIGAAGQPASSASPCQATLELYNGGKGHATLFVSSELATCPVALRQAIDMQYVTKGEFAGLRFTVPEMLRHQVGLDITVVHAEATLNRIVVKKGKKKVGYIESTGCKDADRDLVVTFTDETGASFPAQKTLGRC